MFSGTIHNLWLVIETCMNGAYNNYYIVHAYTIIILYTTYMQVYMWKNTAYNYFFYFFFLCVCVCTHTHTHTYTHVILVPADSSYNSTNNNEPIEFINPKCGRLTGSVLYCTVLKVQIYINKQTSAIKLLFMICCHIKV